MAATEIKMPQLGETVTEGTITKWLKQVGDKVEADELLFEVSTDKVDSEVPTAAAGYLVQILVAEGETVDVGTPIALIGDSLDEAAGAAPPAVEEAPAAEAEQPTLVAEPEAPAAEVEQPTLVAEPEAPAAEVEAPPVAVAEAGARPAPVAPPRADGLVLSPVVRRLIAEHDLDPAQIQGTGEGGRITRNDVLRLIEPARRAAPPPAAAPAARPVAAAPERAEAPAPPAVGEEERIPFSNIRKRTAEHMVRSKATSPHVMMSMEVDFENVEQVRAAHRERWRSEEGFGLTYLPFIARAVCDAIADFPQVNASVEGDTLVVHHYVNLGIAVDLDFQGLIVPVVKGADGKRLRHLAREIRDLAERARSKQLAPDEVSGGTYTITNPGPFGTLVSSPVINQPQVAILSTEGVSKRPVVIEGPGGDAIGIHHVGYLAQSFDHRAFDGAYCASFLRRVKEILETRDWEQELA